MGGGGNAHAHEHKSWTFDGICHIIYAKLENDGIIIARGDGAGEQLPPPPHNAFSEFCRTVYIWKFVDTCKPTCMSFVPTKYWKK